MFALEEVQLSYKCLEYQIVCNVPIAASSILSIPENTFTHVPAIWN